LETSYVGSSPTIGIFLYVAQAVEGVLAVAFGNKLFWFKSHYRDISLCAYLKSWWLQMMVDMKTKMCIFTNNKIEGNKELHEGNVICNCIMAIHNFIAVDRTGCLLLVMADKGG